MKKSNVCGVAGAFAFVTPIVFGFGWLTLLLWLNAIMWFALAQSFREQERAENLRNSYNNGRYNQ